MSSKITKETPKQIFVCLPVDADGNPLKWKASPEKGGWYWIRGKFEGLNKNSIVWFNPHKDRIHAFGNIFLVKDIPEWAGPICMPID